MSLNLATCGNCGHRYMTSNTKTYCMTCQKKIKEDLRAIASKNRHASNQGIQLFEEHKNGLGNMDVTQLEKVIP